MKYGPFITEIQILLLVKCLQSGIQTCDLARQPEILLLPFYYMTLSPEPLRNSTLDTPSPGFIGYFHTSGAFNDNSVYNKFYQNSIRVREL